MMPLLLRRLAATLVTLLVASMIIFGMLDMMPGDAAETLVGDSASQASSLRYYVDS